MLSKLPTKCAWVLLSVLIDFSFYLCSYDSWASRVLWGIHISSFLVLRQEFANASMCDFQLPADITLTNSKARKAYNLRPQFNGKRLSTNVHASKLVKSAVTCVRDICHFVKFFAPNVSDVNLHSFCDCWMNAKDITSWYTDPKTTNRQRCVFKNKLNVCYQVPECFNLHVVNMFFFCSEVLYGS